MAEPRVHLGSYYEIDVCTFEQYEEGGRVSGSVRESNVGLATAPQSLPVPTLTLDAEFPEQYAYEVLIFDLERDRRLVAAVEIVSPANKDRPESRQLFIAECLNLLAPRRLSVDRRSGHDPPVQPLYRAACAAEPSRPGVQHAGAADLRGDLSQTERRPADETGYLVPSPGCRSATPFSPGLVIRNPDRDARPGSEL